MKNIIMTFLFAGMALFLASCEQGTTNPPVVIEPEVVTPQVYVHPTPPHEKLDSIQNIDVLADSKVYFEIFEVSNKVGGQLVPISGTIERAGRRTTFIQDQSDSNNAYAFGTTVLVRVVDDSTGIDTTFTISVREAFVPPPVWLTVESTPGNGTNGFLPVDGEMKLIFSEDLMNTGTVIARTKIGQESIDIQVAPSRDSLNQILVYFPALPPNTEVEVIMAGQMSVNGHRLQQPVTVTVTTEDFVPFGMHDRMVARQPMVDNHGRYVFVGFSQNEGNTHIYRFNGDNGYLDTLATPTWEYGMDAHMDVNGQLYVYVTDDGQGGYVHVNEYDSVDFHLVQTYELLSGGLGGRMSSYVDPTTGEVEVFLSTVQGSTAYLFNVKTGEHTTQVKSPGFAHYMDSNGDIIIAGNGGSSFPNYLTIQKFSRDLDEIWLRRYSAADQGLGLGGYTVQDGQTGNYYVFYFHNNPSPGVGTLVERLEYTLDGSFVVAHPHEIRGIYDVQPCPINGWVEAPGPYRWNAVRVVVDLKRGRYIYVNHTEVILIRDIATGAQLH